MYMSLKCGSGAIPENEHIFAFAKKSSLTMLPDKTGSFFAMRNFLINGKCYRWVFKKCVFQPSRNLLICAKWAKFLRFKVRVSQAECGCL
jgi:hypothetical protein